MSLPNGVMMQFFHWYVPSDGFLWNELAQRSNELSEAGITAVWLPPLTKECLVTKMLVIVSMTGMI